MPDRRARLYHHQLLEPTRHLTGTVFPSTPQGTPATTNIYDNRGLAHPVTLDPLQQATTFTNDLAGRLVSGPTRCCG